MSSEQIVALALLTRREVDRLGPMFDRLYPISETPCFGELLAAIDEADRVWRAEQRSDGRRPQSHSD